MTTSDSNLRSILQSLSGSDPAILLRRFPLQPTAKLSLLDGLASTQVAATPEELSSGKALQTELQSLLGQLAEFEKIGRCPIVGITGILNSGKSSLLATYLSPENRPRVLRGVTNHAGTHRFVFWLPQHWYDDVELRNTLMNLISRVFGHAPELLAESVSDAERQYNGSILHPEYAGEHNDPFSVPLLAFDKDLDQLQLGLMDCPDIQTGKFVLEQSPHANFSTRSGSEGTQGARSVSEGVRTDNLSGGLPESQRSAAARQRWLARLSQLCGAFIVVAKLNSLHDQSLETIFAILADHMPGVKRILAVNRVKARYSPTQVAQQAVALTQSYKIASVYAAYDFRSALADEVVPAAPPDMRPERDGAKQPIFFRVSHLVESSGLPSAAQSAPEYLFHLAKWLDPGSLHAEHLKGLTDQLSGLKTKAITWARENCALRQQQIHDAWQVIAKACYEFMADRDAAGNCIGLRLQTSPALIAQMSDSLRRTAPIWLRLSLSIDRTARQLQQAIAQKTERFKLLQNASSAVTDYIRKWRRGEGAQVVTGESIAESIRKFDMHSAFQTIAKAPLIQQCNSALNRFAAEDQPEFDPQALDKWSKNIWDNMSTWNKLRKGVQPLALVTGPLLAALLIPIDGGGSAVLVFASGKELLAAAGVSILLPPIAGGGETVRIVETEAPWRQFSDLFAILCDSIGIPRPDESNLPSCGNPPKKLLQSRCPQQIDNLETPFSLWEIQ